MSWSNFGQQDKDAIRTDGQWNLAIGISVDLGRVN